MLKTQHRSGREAARRAEGLGRSADGGSFFSHAAGVRAKWDNENISGFARRPDGLREHVPYPPVLPSPADLTACQHQRQQQIRTTVFSF